MQKRYIIIQSDDTRIDPLYYAWMDRASSDVKWTDNLSHATTFASEALAKSTREDLIKLMHNKRVYDCNIEVTLHPKDKPVEPSQPTAQPMPTEQPAEEVITDWGEPRMSFRDVKGNILLALYMKKKEGGLIYAYGRAGEPPKVVSKDGEAVMKAFCVACFSYGTEKIRAFGGKK